VTPIRNTTNNTPVATCSAGASALATSALLDLWSGADPRRNFRAPSFMPGRERRQLPLDRLH
jgi:hypothetical protein